MYNQQQGATGYQRQEHQLQYPQGQGSFQQQVDQPELRQPNLVYSQGYVTGQPQLVYAQQGVFQHPGTVPQPHPGWPTNAPVQFPPNSQYQAHQQYQHQQPLQHQTMMHVQAAQPAYPQMATYGPVSNYPGPAHQYGQPMPMMQRQHQPNPAYTQQFVPINYSSGTRPQSRPTHSNAQFHPNSGAVPAAPFLAPTAISSEPHLPVQQQTQQPPQQQQQQPQSQGPREKKPLPIVNPETKQEVVLASSKTGAVSAATSSYQNSTPPPHAGTTARPNRGLVIEKPTDDQTVQKDLMKLRSSAKSGVPQPSTTTAAPATASPAISATSVVAPSAASSSAATEAAAAAPITRTETISVEPSPRPAKPPTPLPSPEQTELPLPSVVSDAVSLMNDDSGPPSAQKSQSPAAADSPLQTAQQQKSPVATPMNGDATDGSRQSSASRKASTDAGHDSVTAVLERRSQPPTTLLASGKSYDFKPEPGESEKTTLEKKLKYDRQFLLSLQFTDLSSQRPDELPGDIPELLPRSDSQQQPRAVRGFDFTPSYVVQPTYIKDKAKPAYSSHRGGSGRSGGGSGSGGGGPPKPPMKQQVVIEVRKDKVDLHKSDSAYVPGFLQQKKPDDQEQAKKEDIERNIRSILNKIAPQNFESCFSQLTTTCDIGSIGGLNACVDIIFDKATREKSYSSVFAEICKRLAFLKVNFPDQPQAENKQFVGFRSLLLKKCQDMFETPLKDQMEQKAAQWQERIDSENDDKKKALEEERDELVKKMKDQYYGNIRFIGELFMKDILTANIIHQCIVSQLKSDHGNKSMFTESLECLCELLKTVGKKLESENSKKGRIDQYFDRIKKLIKSKEIESKVRFRLQDIVEMRERKWERREMEIRLHERPMTKETVHESVAAVVARQSQPPTTVMASGDFKLESGESEKTTLVKKLTYDRQFLLSLQFTDLSSQRPDELPGDIPELLPRSDSARQEDRSKKQQLLLTAVSTMRKAQKMDVRKMVIGSNQERGQAKDHQDFLITNIVKSRPRTVDNSRHLQPLSADDLRVRRSQHSQNLSGRANERQTVQANVEKAATEKAFISELQCFKTEEEGDVTDWPVVTPDARELAEVAAKIRPIIASLNAENMETSLLQLKSFYELMTVAGLYACMEAMFEKATMEKSLGALFAEVSSRLACLRANIPDQSQDSQWHFVSFKSLLLRKCNELLSTPLPDQLQQAIAPWLEQIEREDSEDIKRALVEQRDQQAIRLRMQYYGNILFVGELYKKGVQSVARVQQCIELLLKPQPYALCDNWQADSLVCLRELMATIHEKLKAECKTSKFVVYLDRIKSFLDRDAMPNVCFQQHHGDVQGARCELGGPSMLKQSWRSSQTCPKQQLAAATTSEWTAVTTTRKAQKMDARKMMIGSSQEQGQAQTRLGPQRPSFVAKARPGGKEDGGRGTPKFGSQKNSRESSASRGTSRDASPHRDAPLQQPTVAALAASGKMPRSQSSVELPARAIETPVMPRDVLERRSKNILMEWLGSLCSLEDTKASFAEIAQHPQVSVFVEANAEHLLNENSKELRERGGQLLFELLNSDLLSTKDLIEGFSPIMEMAEDFLSDFPLLSSYLGEIFSSFVQKAASYLPRVQQLLLKIPAELRDSSRRPLRGEILSRALHLASGRLGHERVGAAFREAGIVWHNLLELPDAAAAADFVAVNKLEFTLQETPISPSPLSLDAVGEQIEHKIISADDQPSTKDLLSEELIAIIEKEVDKKLLETRKFMQVLVRSVCRSCIQNKKLNKGMFLLVKPVLMRHIETQEQQQQWVLSATCETVMDAGYSLSLINDLFFIYLENTIICEDSFKQWHQNASQELQDATRVFIKTLESTHSPSDS